MWNKTNKARLLMCRLLLLFMIAFGVIAIVASGGSGGNADNEGGQNNDSLSFQLEWSKESDQANLYFGMSVSSDDVNGDGYSDILVGAPYYTNVEPQEGKILAYYGSSTGLSGTENWSIESNQMSAYFGRDISNAGDVNGDGYSDIIIGYNILEGNTTYHKMISIFCGSSSGLGSTADWTHEASQYYSSISTAGDVNGDGYSDIILIEDGSAFVYYGSSSGLSSTADWSVTTGDFYTFYAATSAGDVNGDGYSDVIVGEPYNGKNGIVFLYYGSQSGLSLAPEWTFEGTESSAELGYNVSSAGDVNGDGYSDVIIEEHGNLSSSKFYVFYGSSSGLGNNYSFLFQSEKDLNSEKDLTYGSVIGAGDINADGYSDIIASCLGNYHFDGAYEVWSNSKVFVYLGSPSGLSNISYSVLEIERDYPWVLTISTAGDVDGDTYSEIIIGDAQYSSVTGRALLYGISAK